MESVGFIILLGCWDQFSALNWTHFSPKCPKCHGYEKLMGEQIRSDCSTGHQKPCSHLRCLSFSVQDREISVENKLVLTSATQNHLASGKRATSSLWVVYMVAMSQFIYLNSLESLPSLPKVTCLASTKAEKPGESKKPLRSTDSSVCTSCNLFSVCVQGTSGLNTRMLSEQQMKL